MSPVEDDLKCRAKLHLDDKRSCRACLPGDMGGYPLIYSLFLGDIRAWDESILELSRRLELSLAGISQSVTRREKTADDKGFCLIDI